uniref:Endonuclease/exonuclease/phosphatase domain-containing protein n=1 Tax=viral metagenome TaxID=1070528 RepID=A0A6C0EAS1_9ZZZZ
MENFFTVLSQNVWFDPEKRIDRTQSLINNIKEIKPDVICLQEVTESVLSYIKTNLKTYYIFPKELDRTYGCVILSKYPIKNTKVYELTTAMGRNMLLTKIMVQIKKQVDDTILIENKYIIISTCHYESEFGKNNVNKLKQFKETEEILNKLKSTYKNFIHCADTNIVKEEDKYYFQNDWTDVWEKMGCNEENNYTYDSLTNDNLKNRKIKLQTRIDRCIYQSDEFEPVEFRLIKGNPEYIQPSDHHGIYSKFKFI